jgi:two-component system, NarL family, nitrate/nitrite response regulator NarL
MAPRCLIVDDNAEFLRAICSLLDQEGIEVVGVAQTAEAALSSARDLRPDVTLIDIDLDGDSGFAVARRLQGGGGALILTSTHDTEEFAELIEASPAVGFVSKTDLSAQAILALLRH